MKGLQLKVLSVLVIFVFCFLGNYIMIERWISNSKSYGRLINLAGRQRMLIQKLTKEVIMMRSVQGLKTDAVNTEKLFDKTLNALIKGDKELAISGVNSDQIKEQLKRVKTLWNDFKLKIEPVFNGEDISTEYIARLNDFSNNLVKEMNQAVSMMEQRAAGSISTLRNIAIVFFMLSVIITALVFLYIKKSILERILHVIGRTNEMAQYDLVSDVTCKGNDELSSLCHTTRKLTDSWKDILAELISISASLSDTTASVWSEMNNNIKSVNFQNTQAEQIATATEEMSQTSMDIAQNASNAVKMTKAVTKVADESMADMDSTVDVMNELALSSGELGEMMDKLNSSIGQINNVVNIINDIADQTNLLALNAAIEAARAGESGKGFAVVADEVRKLAEKTMRATGEIAETINTIQQESLRTKEQVEHSISKVGKSIELINKTKGALNKIVDHARLSEDEVTKIAAAIEQQSATSEEISQTLEESVRASRDLLENIKSTITEADRMSEKLLSLSKVINKFRLPEDTLIELEKAKTAHKNWVIRLYRMYYSGVHIDPSELTDHTACSFGRWYYGSGNRVCGGYPAFKAIEAPHKEIHSLAKAAVEAFINGEKQKCLELIERVDSISKTIVEHIDALKKVCGKVYGDSLLENKTFKEEKDEKVMAA